MPVSQAATLTPLYAAMRLRCHVPPLQSTLKRVSAPQFTPSICIRCSRSVSSAAYPEKIAVLGAGISGLASAYYLSKEFPKTKITVYESGQKPGGWIQSRRVDVEGGNVLFEYGPRTLRPGIIARPTMQLIQELGLVDQVLYTKSTSVAATNRYLYYPDRLVRLPSSGGGPKAGDVLEFVRSGLAAGVWSVLVEKWMTKRAFSVRDESVGHFIARRFDRRLANNLASAVLHGIYAGDVWQLSARTLFASAWNMEGLYGSVVSGWVASSAENKTQPFSFLLHPFDAEMLQATRNEIKLEEEFHDRLAESATYSLRNGLQELIQALQNKLQSSGQVEFKYGFTAQDQRFISGKEPKMELVVDNGAEETHRYDLVVSSLRDHALTPFVTVMTVNLYFDTPGLLPVKGFGYLIPQSIPFEQNPERALGVLFDSDAVTGQDSAPGTKLTVMLGGHYWDGWEGYPTEDEGLEMARAVISRHLGISATPAASHVTLSKDCIPQYTVGYEDRLADVAMRTRDKYRGRLRLVGSQYHGVGVNDCIRSAWMLAQGVRGNGWKEPTTNLERALDQRTWKFYPAVPLPEGDDS